MSSEAKTSPHLLLEYERLKKLIAEHPASCRLWYEYAVFLHDKYDAPAEALKALEIAQSFCPDKDLRLRLGDALIQSGMKKEGLRKVCQFLGSNPTAFSYRVLAMHLIDMKKRRRARKFLKKAIVLDRLNEESYYLFGELTSLHSKLDSIPYYRKALCIDPDYQLAWRALGYMLLADPKSRDEGLVALRRALELNPNDEWTAMSLGVGYWLAGQPEQAEYYYQMANDMCPEDELYRSYFNAFLSYLEQKRGRNLAREEGN